MRPHAYDFNDAFLLQDFVNKAVLAINAAGIITHQIPAQFFKRWRVLKWILCNKANQQLGLPSQTCGNQKLGIFRSLFGVNQTPFIVWQRAIPLCIFLWQQLF